jgi:hypothetical protein
MLHDMGIKIIDFCTIIDNQKKNPNNLTNDDDIVAKKEGLT